MYNTESIQALIGRIGWYEPIPPTTITLATENEASESGRYFNFFNPLVTVENVFASIPNKDVDNDTLNAILSRLKVEGVMDVLSKVYNLNTRATAAVTNNVISTNYALDYSDIIILSKSYFDEAIGYSVAIKTLELLLTTERSNRSTVANKEQYDAIPQYLKGWFNKDGNKVSNGLDAIYAETIKKLIDVLFPIIYPSGAVIGADGLVTIPTLKARRLW